VGCFPDKAPEDFFLRKRYIERFFDLVDEFVSPSHFLADRYAAWGIDASRIRVRENSCACQRRPLQLGKHHRPPGPLRVGYFGQISKLKGIGVLLDAAKLLEGKQDNGIVFEIHGDDAGQPEEFRQEFRGRIEKAGPNVVYLGPYGRDRIGDLMSEVDVVLVPSIWWENSPLVIQEAQALNRVVGVSRLGGMSEAVRNRDAQGFSFPVGNSLMLVSFLKDIASRVAPDSVRSYPPGTPCHERFDTHTLERSANRKR
jgi:glycosyltransferase involved in cell wall biosynthesis